MWHLHIIKRLLCFPQQWSFKDLQIKTMALLKNPKYYKHTIPTVSAFLNPPNRKSFVSNGCFFFSQNTNVRMVTLWRKEICSWKLLKALKKGFLLFFFRNSLFLPFDLALQWIENNIFYLFVLCIKKKYTRLGSLCTTYLHATKLVFALNILYKETYCRNVF